MNHLQKLRELAEGWRDYMAEQVDIAQEYDRGYRAATLNCVQDLLKQLEGLENANDGGMDRMEFEQLRAALVQAGYKNCFLGDDAQIVAESKCERCDGSMVAHGYRHENSYRAFAKCTNCGAAWEF